MDSATVLFAFLALVGFGSGAICDKLALRQLPAGAAVIARSLMTAGIFTGYGVFAGHFRRIAAAPAIPLAWLVAGVVVNRQVLTQLVQIRKQDARIETVAFEDVLEVDGELLPGKELPPPPAKPPTPERERRRKPRQRSRDKDARAGAPATPRGKGETASSEKPEAPGGGGDSSSSGGPVDEQKGARPPAQDRGAKPAQSRRRRGRRRPRRKGGPDKGTAGGSESASSG